MKNQLIGVLVLGTFLTFLGCSCGFDNSTTIYLVRHAEKVGQEDSLSILGLERANSLSKTLANVKIDHIFSTDYKRTLGTARPLSIARNIGIEMYDPSDLSGFVKLIDEGYKGKSILIVGHSNTTPALINLLLGDEKLNNLDESDYDNLFIVSQTGCNKNSLLNLNYGR